MCQAHDNLHNVAFKKVLESESEDPKPFEDGVSPSGPGLEEGLRESHRPFRSVSSGKPIATFDHRARVQTGVGHQ